ncbi:hypothetical protein ACJZ2D_016695 [Fusarium nematophilum]
MADEYKEHRQCQTCYVQFPTNSQLRAHVEDYRSRERLLLAELERCRMHLAPLNTSGEEEEEEEEEEDEPGSSSQSNPLLCPFKPCSRSEPYTSRGNLVRHCKTHVDCFEMCPFCHEFFVKVNQYDRHNHKSNPDDPKSIFMEERTINLNATVGKKLDQWLEHRSARKRKQVYSASGPAQKKIKNTPISDACKDLSRQPGNSTTAIAIATQTATATKANDQLGNPACKTLTTSCQTHQALDEMISIRDLDDGGLPYPTGHSIDGEQSFGHPVISTTTNNAWALGEWAFSSTAMNTATNDYPLGEWAFADTTIGATTNEYVSGDWAFAHADASAASNNGWILASTAASMRTDDNESALLNAAP